MRILHILDHSIPLQSGYTFRTLAILREQRRLHWETLQLTSAKQGECAALEETVDGWHFHRTRPLRSRLARLPVIQELNLMATCARRIEQIAREYRPDILHAHSPVLNAIPAWYVGRQLGIPVVYEVRAFWEDAAVDHGTSREGDWRYSTTRALDTWVFRRVGHITTICEGLRRDIVARGIPAERVTVIPNAVDIDDFTATKPPDGDLQRRLGLTGQRVLGFIGSFYAYEGLALLLEALPELLKTAPDVHLLLVGGGPQEAALKNQVQALKLMNKVTFTGRVPHGEVMNYYSVVDVLVYPRWSMRLTNLVTPLKPLEAMAQAKLVVASDVGGHQELIRDGETGLLFRAGDPDDLIAKLLKLLNDRAHWQGLQTAARRFVETERNWPVSIARYRQVYGAALKRAV